MYKVDNDFFRIVSKSSSIILYYIYLYQVPSAARIVAYSVNISLFS